MTVLLFSGEKKAIGIEEGKAYRDALEKIIWGGAITDIYSATPKIDPAVFKRGLSAFLPDEAERIEAICRGAVLDPADLLPIWSRELGVTFSLFPPATALIAALGYNRFTEGVPALGVNIDLPVFLLPFLVERRYHPRGLYYHVELSLITMAGALAGINDHGVGAALSLKPFENDGSGPMPLSLIIREVLRHCRDCRGALRLIESMPRGASGTIVIADAYSIMVIEVTPKSLEAREIKSGFHVATGHFLLPTMMGHDLPHDTNWPPTAPSELIGKRVYEVSERRMNRTWEMIEERKVWDSQGLGDLLLDRDREIRLSSGFYKTSASALMIPAKKTLFHCTGRKDKFTRIFL
jgi:hypothetical protein